MAQWWEKRKDRRVAERVPDDRYGELLTCGHKTWETDYLTGYCLQCYPEIREEYESSRREWVEEKRKKDNEYADEKIERIRTAQTQQEARDVIAEVINDYY